MKIKDIIIYLFENKPLALFGFVIFFIYLIIALIGPFFVSDPFSTNTPESLLSPSIDHIMGTDKFGRDIFSRAIHSARLDIFLGVTISLFALIIGSLIGVISG